MSPSTETLGVAGGGAIATGLAATAAAHGLEVKLWARTRERAEKGLRGAPVELVDEPEDLASCSFLVEAVAEDPEVKGPLLGRLGAAAGPEAVLATTTSSLSVEKLAEATGRADRFVGLHVFNPVKHMELVELCFASGAADDVKSRSHALCDALHKSAVEVPDVRGFVVNRLLFPYLFSAVAFLEETGLAAEDVDRCMKLGAGHPMGPLALLDFVGMDVSAAIGEAIGADVPKTVHEHIAAGRLGRKSGEGFFTY